MPPRWPTSRKAWIFYIEIYKMCNIHVQVEIRKCENTIFEWKGPFHHIRQRTIYLRVHDSPSLAMKNHPLRLVSSQNSLKCCFRLPIARISWTICLLFVGPNGYRTYLLLFCSYQFPPDSKLILFIIQTLSSRNLSHITQYTEHWTGSSHGPF